MKRRRRRSYWIAQQILVGAYLLIYGLKIRGAHKVPLDDKILLAPNHRSYLDPPLSGLGLKREVYFFAKKELFKNPIFAKLIESLNAKPVRRTGVDKDAVRIAESLLNDNRAVVIFPEGTRCRKGDFLKPKKGIALMALRANTDIIPVTILGTRPWWKSILHRGRMSVSYGDIIKCEDAKKQDDTDQQMQWIVDEIENFWHRSAQLNDAKIITTGGS
jgi:1-acyl-sn-glycerol-3-phosphate acyltransferase